MSAKSKATRFDCKMATRPFTLNSSAILARVDYAAVKLEITYIYEVPLANLTQRSITEPSFDFVIKAL